MEKRVIGQGGGSRRAETLVPKVAFHWGIRSNRSKNRDLSGHTSPTCITSSKKRLNYASSSIHESG